MQTVTHESHSPDESKSSSSIIGNPAIEKHSLLSWASLRLLETLDLNQTLATVIEIFVPRIARMCAIYFRDSSGSFRLSDAKHTDPSKNELLWEFDKRVRPNAEYENVLSKTHISRKPLSFRSSHDYSKLLEVQSFACIPFGFKTFCSGVCVVATGEGDYCQDDLELFEDLGLRISLAIRNAEFTKSFQKQYSEIVNGLDAIVWESDITRQHYHYISKHTERLIGYPVSKWLNEEGVWQTIIHPADKDYVITTYTEHVSRGEELDFEYRIITASGKTRWIRDLFTPVKNAEDKPEKVRGIILDVSDTHQTADALMKSESALRIFADSVDDYAIIMMDAKGTITNWNYGAESIMQYTAEEVIGQPDTILFTPEDIERDVAALERTVATSGRSAEDNRWHLRKDGTRFWALGVLTALRDERGELLGFVKLARDMTSQKFKEEELQRAKEAAEVANEAKGQFLAIMSHELRTPLGAMIGFADALLDTELPENKRLEYAGTIRSSGERLSTLINDILDLSKVEAGRLEIERHDFPVNEVIREISILLGTRAQEKSLDIRLVVDKEIPSTISSDPSRLRQILINIIGNAIKFTSKGHIEVRVSHRDAANYSDSKLCIIVTDTGPGIPEPMQEQLFQPFIQADTSIARRFGGTGLGLALSRRLARALGGDITLLWSRVGEGSSFEICIAVGDITNVPMISTLQTSRAPIASKSTIPTNSPLKGLRFLVVDDAPENRLLISHILKRGGCLSVESVENGQLGVNAAEGNDFDIIIMDMQMPILDGFDATATLRRKGYEKPIIALTAHAMPEERLKCIAAGCDEFLVKPIETAKLFEAILSVALRGCDVQEN